MDGKKFNIKNDINKKIVMYLMVLSTINNNRCIE